MYGRYNNHHKSGRYRTSRSRSISRSKRSPSPMPSKDDRRYSRDRDGRSSSRDRSRCIDYRNSREDRRRYRSRSRSTRRYRSKYSRSKSRSYSPRGRGRSVDKRRSHSRSPLSGRRRHENPEVSRCLGVFGLSVYTSETQIRQIFSKYGPVERVEVVIDAKTGRSRGFCFVYFENTDDAKVAKENCSGLTIDDRKIRVDYSITQRAHTPTPGVYMGKPTRAYRDKDYERSDRGSRYNSRDDDYYYEKRYRDRRSPSPYYSRRRSSRYDRSRSRSYSPRDRRYR